MDEVASCKLTFPVAVRLDLVDEHRALLTTVSGQVALPVTVDVEPAYSTRPSDGVLEHAREHRLASPGHVLGHPDVHGQQGANGTHVSAAAGAARVTAFIKSRPRSRDRPPVLRPVGGEVRRSGSQAVASFLR